MNIEPIIKNIRTQGGRITKVRKLIIQILLDSNCLLSRIDILVKLKKQKIKPNRSTIFRELTFLTQHQIILKNTIADVDYYEIAKEHHHHLVCLNCNSIKKVSLAYHLTDQEKQIAKQNQFNIINHTLEFYGYCHNCQT